MRKSTLFKLAAITVCLGFFLLMVPTANAIERKAQKFDYKIFLKKPAMLISSIIPFFTSIFDTGKNTNSTYKNNSAKKIKITGTLSCDKPSDGD